MRFQQLIAASVLALSTVPAFAETNCGRRAIASGSEWFLVVHSLVNTTCDVTFTGRRGQFSGNCVTLDEEQNGPPHVGYSTISGRLVISNSCAVTGTADVVEGQNSQSVILNGRLWSHDVSGRRRPSAGAGVGYAPNVSGIPSFVDWQLIQRANDDEMPRVPTPD